MASPGVGTPALKYGYVNTVTPSPGEAKGLIKCQTIEKTLAEAFEINNNPNDNYIKNLKVCFNSLDSLILKVKESKVEDDNTSKEKNS